VWMLRCSVRNALSTSEVAFAVALAEAGPRARPHLLHLHAVCGPGDNAEPVITVMLPHED